MTEFAKMDIFFFVTTLCIILLTLAFTLVLYKLWRILEYVERIAEVAGAEAEHIKEDAAYVRGRLMGVLDAAFSFLPRGRRHMKKEG
jgi:hypothetical protein